MKVIRKITMGIKEKFEREDMLSNVCGEYQDSPPSTNSVLPSPDPITSFPKFYL